MTQATVATKDVPASNRSEAAVPYLLGFSPRGPGYERSGPSEIIYPRALTEDEIRARHLYWGKAPAEVKKGLPKFDGKDFYPASPEKPVGISVAPASDPKSKFDNSLDVSYTLNNQKLRPNQRDAMTPCMYPFSSRSSDPFSEDSGAKPPSYDTRRGNWTTDHDNNGGTLPGASKSCSEADVKENHTAPVAQGYDCQREPFPISTGSTPNKIELDWASIAIRSNNPPNMK